LISLVRYQTGSPSDRVYHHDGHVDTASWRIFWIPWWCYFCWDQTTYVSSWSCYRSWYWAAL